MVVIISTEYPQPVLRQIRRICSSVDYGKSHPVGVSIDFSCMLWGLNIIKCAMAAKRFLARLDTCLSFFEPPTPNIFQIGRC